MQEDKSLYNTFKAPTLTRWTIIISLKNKTQYTFLDKNLEFISKYKINKKYNPITRPWYKQAISSDTFITTAPYMFANLQKVGISFATKIQLEGAVLAIDYTLLQLNDLLALQAVDSTTEVFIFNSDGIKVASSNRDTKELDKTLLDTFSKNKIDKIVKYTHLNNEYLTMYKTLNNKDLFIGIKVDSKNLLKPYINNIKYSLIISFLLILIFIPIIFLAIKVIVKPIKQLIIQNEKIKNREYEKVENINTNIIEFLELSNSLVSMSKNIQEYEKSQEEILNSIVKLIAEAIDAKSRYTGEHCKRVPEIAQMLVKAASNSQDTIFKSFTLNTKDEIREFELGAWLHDCGKVTTPEYVIDKSTKLETINDRIHEVRTRFEVLWRDSQISYMQKLLNNEDKKIALQALHVEQKELTQDFAFIASANIGGEFMDIDKQNRIKKIAAKEWERNFDDFLGLGEVEKLRYDKNNIQALPATEKLLNDKKQHIIKRDFFDHKEYIKDGFKEEVPEYLYNYGEVYNLCIPKGTLNHEERYKINEHVIMSIKMLEKIPFPSHLSKIPQYAGTHHETLLGSGYPRQLNKNDLSIPDRVMAIADIFEALTASDRPYKKAKTLSESIKIMSLMAKDKHIDEDLFKLFLSEDLHVEYAKKYLKNEQIDNVDIEQYL